MKGVVFVELLNMAEKLAGEDLVDEVLDSCELENDGAYSAVGNYPCNELMALVQAFSDRLEQPADLLQKKFGHWMFSRFVEGYPQFFVGKTTAFAMLESIEDQVHVEVRKLYPNVELPTFATHRINDETLQMIYKSERPLVSFCEGMIEACADHFGTSVQIGKIENHIENEYQAEFEIRLSA